MDAQIYLQQKLREKLSELQAKNPAYSLRAFSRKLGLNSGVVSSVLNGKRGVSRNTAVQIADRLGLDPQERSELLTQFPERRRQRHVESRRIHAHAQLNADQFHVISGWQHFAILSLMKTSDFRPDADWIATRLGIKAQDARAAIERLERLGMIEADAAGVWRRAHPQYRTPDDVANASIRRAHAQNLELAQRSLERDEVHERDFTGMVFAMDPAKLPEAKERVRKFQDELAEFLETGNKSEVFTFCTQLMPLTKQGVTK